MWPPPHLAIFLLLIPYAYAHTHSAYTYEFGDFWGCAYNQMCFPIELHSIWKSDKARTGGSTYNRRCTYDREITVYLMQCDLHRDFINCMFQAHGFFIQ